MKDNHTYLVRKGWISLKNFFISSNLFCSASLLTTLNMNSSLILIESTLSSSEWEWWWWWWWWWWEWLWWEWWEWCNTWFICIIIIIINMDYVFKNFSLVSDNISHVVIYLYIGQHLCLFVCLLVVINLIMKEIYKIKT